MPASSLRPPDLDSIFFFAPNLEKAEKTAHPKKMPPAGPDRSKRAIAHYRWAERYSDAGEPAKSLVHMERALDYTRGTKTRFGGATFYASQIVEIVFNVMKTHNLTEFRTGNDHLPKIDVHQAAGAYTVSIEYNVRVLRRECAHFSQQPELSLQSIADALDDLSVEAGVPTDLRIKLQMYMGEAYVKLIEEMRAQWASEGPEGADGAGGAKRPRA